MGALLCCSSPPSRRGLPALFISVGEHLGGVELGRAACGGTARSCRWWSVTGLGEQVLDAVLPADPVEEHLHRRAMEPAGEHLARCRSGSAAAPHGLATPPRARHRPAGCAHAASTAPTRRTGSGRRPRSAPSPWCRQRAGTRPRRPSATTRSAAARSQRFHDWSRRRRARRVDHPGPDQAPVHRRLRRHRVDPRRGSSSRDPPRTPIRARPAHLRAPRPRPPAGIWCGHEAGRCDRSARPSNPRPHTGPATHAASAATPPLTSDLTDRPAISDHRENRLIPLLCHAQLPHIEGVSRISRSSRQPSAEDV